MWRMPQMYVFLFGALIIENVNGAEMHYVEIFYGVNDAKRFSD